MSKINIEVYVCPTPGCGNYYGASGIERLPLGDEFTGPRMEDKAAHEINHGSQFRHSRAACPDCRQRGVAVERALIRMEVRLPDDPPPTPELPGSNNSSRRGGSGRVE